jgi:hypothetical protein
MTLTIDLRTPQQMMEQIIAGETPASFASGSPRHGSYLLYVDATLLHSLGYAEDDPNRWWDGVVR